MPAEQLTLSFAVQNFEATTSVVFTVVAPPPDTAQRHVSFFLTGNVRGVSSLSPTAMTLLVTSALSNQLNTDVSRLVNVTVTVGQHLITLLSGTLHVHMHISSLFLMCARKISSSMLLWTEDV